MVANEANDQPEMADALASGWADLEKAKERLRWERDEFEQEKTALKREQEENTRQWIQLERKTQELQAEWEAMEKEKAGFEIIRAGIVKDRDACRRTKAQTEQMMAELQAGSQRLANERRALHAEVDATKQQVIAKWDKLSEKRDEMEALRHTIAEERRLADEHKAKVVEDVRREREEIHRYERRFLEIAQEQEKIEEAHKELESAREQLAGVRRELEAREEELAQEKGRSFEVRQRLVDEKEAAAQEVEAMRKLIETEHSIIREAKAKADRETQEWEKAWIKLGEKTEELEAGQALLAKERRELDLEKGFIQRVHRNTQEQLKEASGDKFEIERVWLQVQVQKDELAKAQREAEEARALFERETQALAAGIKKNRAEEDALCRAKELFEQQKEVQRNKMQKEHEDFILKMQQVQVANETALQQQTKEAQEKDRQSVAKAMQSAQDEGDALYRERQEFEREKQADRDMIEKFSQTVHEEQQRVAEQRRQLQELYKAQVDDIQERMMHWEDLVSKACASGAMDPEQAEALRQRTATRTEQGQQLRQKLFGIPQTSLASAWASTGCPVVGRPTSKSWHRGHHWSPELTNVSGASADTV